VNKLDFVCLFDRRDKTSSVAVANKLVHFCPLFAPRTDKKEGATDIFAHNPLKFCQDDWIRTSDVKLENNFLLDGTYKVPIKQKGPTE